MLWKVYFRDGTDIVLDDSDPDHFLENVQYSPKLIEKMEPYERSASVSE